MLFIGMSNKQPCGKNLLTPKQDLAYRPTPLLHLDSAAEVTPSNLNFCHSSGALFAQGNGEGGERRSSAKKRSALGRRQESLEKFLETFLFYPQQFLLPGLVITSSFQSCAMERWKPYLDSDAIYSDAIVRRFN